MEYQSSMVAFKMDEGGRPARLIVGAKHFVFKINFNELGQIHIFSAAVVALSAGFALDDLDGRAKQGHGTVEFGQSRAMTPYD
jgi:hypothetical protein